jgi:ATP-dependent Zn protease
MTNRATNETEADSANSDKDTAHHEAGHAVIGCLYDRPPSSVTIVRDGAAAGKAEFDPDIPDFARSYLNQSAQKRAYTEARVVGELSGSAAHDLFRPGRTPDQGDRHDLHWAKELISELVSWEDHDKYLEQARVKAKQLLRDNWEWVQAVARALLERKTLSRHEILDLNPNKRRSLKCDV